MLDRRMTPSTANQSCWYCSSNIEVVKTDNGMPRGHPRYEEIYLCFVCRSTHAGNVYMFPEQYRDDVALILAKVIVECTHLILEAIKEPKK